MENPIKVNDKIAICEAAYYTPEQWRELVTKGNRLPDEIEAEKEKRRRICPKCMESVYCDDLFTSEEHESLAAIAKLEKWAQHCNIGITIDFGHGRRIFWLKGDTAAAINAIEEDA